jgi:hypothetical protein
MNFGLILLPIFFISVVQVAHAQSLTDSINNAVNNDIGNTFDSINQAAKSNINSLSGNDNGSQPTTTTTTTTAHGPGNSNSTTTTMKTNSQN